MPDVLLLLPDFLLIFCGFVLCRYTALDRPVWEAAERLVYYLLFPVLLFNSIVKTPLHPGVSAWLALAGFGTCLGGIAMAYALRLFPRVDAHAHASGAQVAFRFNSYIALALSERLQGAQGVAWVALLIALCVPLCNVAAVYPLARRGGYGYWRELARNPLIIATVAGMLANGAGLKLPEAAALTLNRIGVAALPLGLMAVGAGLRFGALKESPGLAAALLAIRHALMPLLALVLALAFALPPAQRALLMLFAALPTSASSYVLAQRMGGHGAFVAGLVTLSTLLGMVSLPLWLGLLDLL